MYDGGTYALLSNLFGRLEDTDFRMPLGFLNETVELGLIDVADIQLVVGVDFGVDVTTHAKAH